MWEIGQNQRSKVRLKVCANNFARGVTILVNNMSSCLQKTRMNRAFGLEKIYTNSVFELILL